MDIPSWLADTFGDITIGQLIIWVVVLVLVILGIRKAWPALKAIVQFADTWQKLPGFMRDTSDLIERLRAQVENDHKTNLRDELTQALATLQNVQESVEGMHGRMDSLEASNERQEQSIDGLHSEVIVVQEKLTRDHRRLSILEDTIPKDKLRELTEQPHDEPDE